MKIDNSVDYAKYISDIEQDPANNISRIILVDFGEYFTYIINKGDPLYGKPLSYEYFRSVVKYLELKMRAIAILKQGIPHIDYKGIWKAFYAMEVVPMRKELFPNIQANISKYNEEKNGKN